MVRHDAIVKDAEKSATPPVRLQGTDALPNSKAGDAAPFSNALARRALLVTLTVAWCGAAVGIVGARLGTVQGNEFLLICSSLTFSSGALITIFFFRRVALQTVATIATIYFSLNLCTGMVISTYGPGDPLNFFIYLVWFFPLVIVNRLVNQPHIGRFLTRFLRIAPLLSIACLLPRLLVIFKATPLSMVAVYFLCYLGFCIGFDIISRYREQFVVEREREESLKLANRILESISDCFISLDSNFRLIYLNDAACREFAVERSVALQTTLALAAPAFCSPSMRAGIEMAFANSQASVFEAQHNEREIWYVVRCYPQAGGMSVYFQNVTRWVLSRRELEKAQERLREQAELLDKAHDAILLAELDSRLRYWNKGAERLYGWTSEEAIGRFAADIFLYDRAEMNVRVAATVRDGSWAGEISQRHRDGRILTVESHLTLVKGEDGEPECIMAINTDVTQRKAVEAKMQRLAFYDTLTELPNRQLLRERLDRALTLADRQSTTGALLFIDLDEFKTLNDTLGHHIGDLLLQQAAARLTSCTRQTDTVARLGGDEFVVMLEGLGKDAKSAGAAAKVVADKILEAFHRPFQLAQYEHESTASIGIALFAGSSDSADDLLKRADLAMYRAKSQGRDAMSFFDPEMQTYVTNRVALRADLRRALLNNEFELFYQPQVNNEGQVMSAEALLRWRHPQRGMVPPNEFIPLAEQAGLIVEIGRWVLETACSQLAKWAASPMTEHLSIAVNVSLRQLLDPHFVDLVLGALRQSGAEPNRLKLEMTESSMLEKLDDTIAKIAALKVSGIEFSVDDFGTGYSSLSHLKRLPLDQLKVDRSFIKDLLTDHKDASIARTIITLGVNLNLTVIAEGVETEGQRAFLEREGCHMYQGFLFSPALQVAPFEAFLAARHQPASAQLTPLMQ
jgi:diguanylate cyclase (GGDEF)-like protein/PAS domain S-box-containing protein